MQKCKKLKDILAQKTSKKYNLLLEKLPFFQKKVKIPFSFIEDGNSGLFEGKITIDRTDFKVLGPFFGFFVGDEFEVDIKVPVNKM